MTDAETRLRELIEPLSRAFEYCQGRHDERSALAKGQADAGNYRAASEYCAEARGFASAALFIKRELDALLPSLAPGGETPPFRTCPLCGVVLPCFAHRMSVDGLDPADTGNVGRTPQWQEEAFAGAPEPAPGPTPLDHIDAELADRLENDDAFRLRFARKFTQSLRQHPEGPTPGRDELVAWLERRHASETEPTRRAEQDAILAWIYSQPQPSEAVTVEQGWALRRKDAPRWAGGPDYCVETAVEAALWETPEAALKGGPPFPDWEPPVYLTRRVSVREGAATE